MSTFSFYLAQLHLLKLIWLRAANKRLQTEQNQLVNAQNQQHLHLTDQTFKSAQMIPPWKGQLNYNHKGIPDFVKLVHKKYKNSTLLTVFNFNVPSGKYVRKLEDAKLIWTNYQTLIHIFSQTLQEYWFDQNSRHFQQQGWGSQNHQHQQHQHQNNFHQGGGKFNNNNKGRGIHRAIFNHANNQQPLVQEWINKPTNLNWIHAWYPILNKFNIHKHFGKQRANTEVALLKNPWMEKTYWYIEYCN